MSFDAEVITHQVSIVAVIMLAPFIPPRLLKTL